MKPWKGKLTEHPKLKTLPPLMSTAGMKIEEMVVPVKVFVTGTGITYWLTELDPESMVAFGFCLLLDPRDAEFGHVDLKELEETKLAFGCFVEVDEWWDPKTRMIDIVRRTKGL